MNILFLTIIEMDSVDVSGMYQDIMREFKKHGHNIYIISPNEKLCKKSTLTKSQNVHILNIKTETIQKTNILKKGIATVMLESQFLKAIKKYFSDVKFDLVLYSTPPITLTGAVQYVRKRDGAKTYLMLKDIFPQNAVDLRMMQTKGIKALIYKYFRRKEQKLYALSDRIGCMSQANADYILRHNPKITKEKVEICPNCLDVRDMRLSEGERSDMRIKYGIPQDKKVFVYGGNLGRPQDVPFIVECLKQCADMNDGYFVIAGSGTDRHFLEEYIAKENPSHVKLFGQIPKDEYDKMIACCDVGLIFLDHRFTIPNFPSRLLSYMQAGLPVLACTDSNTDVGNVIENGGFGRWCESDDPKRFAEMVQRMSELNLPEYGEISRQYLLDAYSVQKIYTECFANL